MCKVNTCSYCVYCEYRRGKYYCRYEGENYIVRVDDRACEDYMTSEVPACREKGIIPPRRMGRQW